MGYRTVSTTASPTAVNEAIASIISLALYLTRSSWALPFATHACHRESAFMPDNDGCVNERSMESMVGYQR